MGLEVAVFNVHVLVAVYIAFMVVVLRLYREDEEDDQQERPTPGVSLPMRSLFALAGVFLAGLAVEGLAVPDEPVAYLIYYWETPLKLLLVLFAGLASARYLQLRYEEGGAAGKWGLMAGFAGAAVAAFLFFGLYEWAFDGWAWDMPRPEPKGDGIVRDEVFNSSVFAESGWIIYTWIVLTIYNVWKFDWYRRRALEQKDKTYAWVKAAAVEAGGTQVVYMLILLMLGFRHVWTVVPAGIREFFGLPFDLGATLDDIFDLNLDKIFSNFRFPSIDEWQGIEVNIPNPVQPLTEPVQETTGQPFDFGGIF